MSGKFRIILISVFLLMVFTSTYAKEAAIVAGKKTTVTEKFAAEELQKYLAKITGVSFEIKDSKQLMQFSFLVGNSLVDNLQLQQDEYIIRSSSNQVILSGGGNRGTLYAVYDLLEKLGCRWYYPDPADEIVPELSIEEVIEKVKGLNVVARPDFSVRMTRFLTYDIGKAGESLADGVTKESLLNRIDWLTKNRTNIFQYGIDHGISGYNLWSRYRNVFPEMQKRGMVIGMGGHNMFLFISGTQLKQHIDWQCMRDGKRTASGQFCTRNDEAVTEYLTNCVAFLKANPEIEYLTPWPNDMGKWCQCQLCKDTPSADRFMQFGKRIHNVLKNEVPNVEFAHFAYGSHVKPPAKERPIKGMTISLCTWGRDFNKLFYEEGTSKEFRDEFAAWREIVTEYNCKFILHEKYARHLGLGFHPMYIKNMKPELKWFRDNGLDGFELPMGAMGRRTKAFNFYVLAKLMWDIETDTEEVMRDYFEKVYGQYAKQMREIYQLVEDAQPDLHYFQNINKKFLIYEYDYVAKASKLLERASDKLEKVFSEVKDADVKRKMARFKISFDYTNLQWQTAKTIVEGDMAIESAYLAENGTQFDELLNKADRLITKAIEKSKLRNEMIAKHAGDGLLWDVVEKGGFCVFKDGHLGDRVKKLDKLKQYNFDTLPENLWQIGIFDGSDKELGVDIYKFAKETTYTINADHGKQSWMGFMGKHLPDNAENCCSVKIIFSVEQVGKYILTVGQLNTWQSKTIDVLLDDKKIGNYTTAKDNQSKVHEIVFEMASVGQHSITLSKFAKGDGYPVDAVKLAKIAKKK
ncbi:MAG: DUF4838 domain-containing protein [Planctomycetes bacterium]|nr:DUF4838 domain-containing protein [Planctomycetota bacterium]